MPPRKKPENTPTGGLSKRIRKNFEPGARRNGPFTPEELIPYGIRRPMATNYNRDRMFKQTGRILTQCCKQMGITKPLGYHLAVLYLVEKINQAAAAAGAVGMDISKIEQPTDYVPLEGVYEGWDARYQAALARIMKESTDVQVEQ